MAAACPGVKDINGDDWIGGKPFSPVSIVDMAFENSQLTLFGRIVCSPGAFWVADAADARIEDAWAAAEPVTEARADWAAAIADEADACFSFLAVYKIGT